MIALDSYQILAYSGVSCLKQKIYFTRCFFPAGEEGDEFYLRQTKKKTPKVFNFLTFAKISDEMQHELLFDEFTV